MSTHVPRLSIQHSKPGPVSRTRLYFSNRLYLIPLMNIEAIVQTLLRLLPWIAIASLGLVAAADPKTRARWSDLLYYTGSLRPELRGDVKVQSGAKWPFFLVAAVFLIWPVLYYRYATRVIEINPDFMTAKPASPLMQAAPNAPSKAAPGTLDPPQANTMQNSAAPASSANPLTSAPTAAPTTSKPVSSSPLFSTTPPPTTAPAPTAASAAPSAAPTSAP